MLMSAGLEVSLPETEERFWLARTKRRAGAANREVPLPL